MLSMQLGVGNTCQRLWASPQGKTSCSVNLKQAKNDLTRVSIS